MEHSSGNNNGFGIGALFDRIASSYDRLNHLLSLNIDRQWRRRAVSEISNTQHSTPNTILDVAIGTADLTLEILCQGKADHINGLDVSRQMMAIGEQKVAKAGYADKVTFEYGSALEMPYMDQSFDVVTCAYGVRNFSDLERGLKEMYRVLKPEGQVMILEFSYPTNCLIRASYNLYFTYVLPWVGKVLSHDKTAYNYLNESVKAFPYGLAMVQKISEAGFTNIRFKPLSFGISTMYWGIKNETTTNRNRL